MAAADPHVKVIFNARNYGPFRSTFNGLRHATGDAVVVLFAADLQDPPEIIAEFVRNGARATRSCRASARSARNRSPCARRARPTTGW